MAVRAKTICNYPGCSELVDKGFCDTHKKEKEKQRRSSADRGYTVQWRKIRKMFLMKNPLCFDCFNKGWVIAANEVHHIKALRNGGTHDSNNLMQLCKSCHSKRTSKGE